MTTMSKGFTAIFKSLSRPAQPENGPESPEYRPQTAWNSTSDSPGRWGLRHRERSFASLSSATLRSSSRKRGLSKHRQSTAALDDEIPDLPPLDPSLFYAAPPKTSDQPSAHVPKSSISTKECSFDSSVGESPQPVNTPHSSIATQATPSYITTPTSSRFSARQSSRSVYDAAVGQTPSRSKARHDSHAFESPNYIDLPLEKLLATETFDLDATTIPLYNEESGEASLDIHPAHRASPRNEHDRMQSIDSFPQPPSTKLGTPPQLRKISSERKISGERKIRASEDGRQSSSRGTASFEKSAPASARSSTVSQKRSSRRRHFAEGHRPAPLILSSSVYAHSPPLTGPPSYPPPPNPLERMETRVQQLEEQLYLLNMRVAALTAAQQEGKTPSPTE